jgi:hypothetical protein
MKVEVQGTADLSMSLCGGLAAFASGFIKQEWGFHVLADISAVAAAVLLVVVWFTRTRTSRPMSGSSVVG